MNTLITSGITEGQKTQYTRIMEDIVRHGTKLALEKVETNNGGWQRVLEHGDELKLAVAEIIVAKTSELSVSNQFTDEEVKSNYGYLSGYTKPVSVENQIDILRSHWPVLNPDGAIRYMREVYPSLQFPKWVEGPFALIRPGFFSEAYGEEFEEVLKALAKSCNGKFENYRAGRLGPKYLRQSMRTVTMTNRIIEQQPGSDIVVVSEQFGIRHRGKSVRRAREVFAGSEFGEGAKNIGTMILTNPIRLQHYDDLWLDCPGDEYSPDADASFAYAPFFDFHVGRVKFDTHSVVYTSDPYGSVSSFLPQ